MCGRYQFTAVESRELQEILRAVERNMERPARTGEIFPTNEAVILTEHGSEIAPSLCAWGFPGFGKNRTVINARAETAAEKPTFRKSLEARRCVVPASGFFEWDEKKEKHLFTLPNSKELYMAGLWNAFAGEPHFVILTTAANPSVAPIHHRMPVVLERDAVLPWLTNPAASARILTAVPPALQCQTA